jgi:hypothetical protein
MQSGCYYHADKQLHLKTAENCHENHGERFQESRRDSNIKKLQVLYWMHPKLWIEEEALKRIKRGAYELY